MARRKITEAPETLPAELPDLDEREIDFANRLLKGESATDAYIQSHSVYDWKRTSAQVAASRLANSERVQLWMSYARLGLMTEGVVSLEQHIRSLDRLMEIAVSTGNIGAAVQAEQLKGKASGLYAEKIEDTTLGKDVMGWLDKQAEQLRGDPVALKHLHDMATRYGIAWQPKVLH